MSSVSKLKLAWLAGLFDAEGIVSFYYVKNGDHYSPQKKISIDNSDLVIVNEVKSIFESIVGHEINVYDDKHIREEKVHAYLCYKVMSHNTKDIEKILLSIYPYLVGKKMQVSLILKLIAEHKPYTKHSESDLKIVDELKALKRNYTYGISKESLFNEFEDNKLGSNFMQSKFSF